MSVCAVSADAVRPLRGRVLRPGRPAHELHLPGDEREDTLHVACLRDGVVVGVATVIADRHPRDPRAGDWRIRGMATAPEVRGTGIGAQLLERCLAHARSHDGGRVWCNARSGARGFYERAGFAVEGEEFEIPGIGTHVVMSRVLTGR